MGLFSRLTEPVTVTAPGQHLAERCRDDWCHRLPCRMYKQGYERGLEDGYAAGFAAGYSEGYSSGYSAGAADKSG